MRTTTVHGIPMLDPDRIVALAEAVEMNRAPQRQEIDEVRERAQAIVARDVASARTLECVQGDLVAANPGLGDGDGPGRIAFDAALDALLAVIAGPMLTKAERDVLMWPWISVCGARGMVSHAEWHRAAVRGVGTPIDPVVTHTLLVDVHADDLVDPVRR